MTPAADMARQTMGVDEDDMRMLKKRRKQERALSAISGAVISFVASYILVKDLWWSDQDFHSAETYPYAAAALLAGRGARGTALMLVTVIAISAVAGAVAAIIFGEPEPASAIKYGVLDREE